MSSAIHEDSWLSSIFGYSVFRIDCSKPCEALPDTLREHSARERKAFYYAKVPASDVALVRSLTSVGMYTVDVNVTFELNINGAKSYPENTKIFIDELKPHQHEDVLKIAESAFLYSRFHLDPSIPKAIANRIKREWIASYLIGRRGEMLLVATEGGTPVGFLAVLAGTQDESSRIIDLIAVDSRHRRIGVGEALIKHLVKISTANCSAIAVGTQVANVPSIRMYEKLGFLLKTAQHVLHMHVPSV